MTGFSVNADGDTITNSLIIDTYKFPTTVGSHGQILQVDGSGDLTFVDNSGGGGGGAGNFTSLTNEGNITNVGTISVDKIKEVDSTTGLTIDLNNNSTDALKEGGEGETYMKFDTNTLK